MFQVEYTNSYMLYAFAGSVTVRILIPSLYLNMSALGRAFPCLIWKPTPSTYFKNIFNF